MGEKLVAPLIATSKVDKCNRRQTRTGYGGCKEEEWKKL
jgi:hypothetical protein